MDKNKLLKFLAFFGIENASITEQIKDSPYNMTDVVLFSMSERLGESMETVRDWYSRYNGESFPKM